MLFTLLLMKDQQYLSSVIEDKFGVLWFPVSKFPETHVRYAGRHGVQTFIENNVQLSYT
jgi:hypothetical protein